MMRSPSKILVLRTDRLGDVMMTLPSLEFLRTALPQSEINFLCAPTYEELLTPYFNSRNIGWVNRVEKGYEAVLLLNAESRYWWEVAKAGIRTRVGIYSKPLSFLLLNAGVRQRRSLSLQNEALYNLELVKLLLQKLRIFDLADLPSKIELPSEEHSAREASRVIQAAGIRGPFILFHPGMGGSALNISPEQYLGLMTYFQKQGAEILLSVGPLLRDGQMQSQILAAQPKLAWYGGVSLAVLREIFRKASLVVAPSTGPLHLAHFVGTDTIGIYPPVRSQHPDRWAPWGGTGKSQIYYPRLSCPGTQRCIGESCDKFNCMEKTDWQSLLERGNA